MSQQIPPHRPEPSQPHNRLPSASLSQQIEYRAEQGHSRQPADEKQSCAALLDNSLSNGQPQSAEIHQPHERTAGNCHHPVHHLSCSLTCRHALKQPSASPMTSSDKVQKMPFSKRLSSQRP